MSFREEAVWPLPDSVDEFWKLQTASLAAVEEGSVAASLVFFPSVAQNAFLDENEGFGMQKSSFKVSERQLEEKKKSSEESNSRAAWQAMNWGVKRTGRWWNKTMEDQRGGRGGLVVQTKNQ